MDSKGQDLKGTVVFNIFIKEEYGGFALASNFISQICSCEKLCMSDVIGIRSLFLRDCKMNEISEMAAQIVRFRDKFLPIKKPELLNDNIKNYQVIYCLWIEENALSDVVDMQYDCLLKKYFSSENIVTILSGSRSLYHKVSHYLYDLGCIHEDLYNTTYFVDVKQKQCKVQRLQQKNIGRLKDFMPLYFFDRGELDLFSLLGNKVSPEKLLKIYEGEDSDVAAIPAIHGCVALLKASITSIKGIQAKQVIDMICQGNIFSFFIFCYSLSAFIGDIRNDLHRLRKYYLKVREYAAGCEQLIENAIHHSETHCGVVTIRFHEADSKYLSKRYGNSLKKVPHLEILITDYAGINRSGNMADNFRAHLEYDNKEAFKGMQPIDLLIDGDGTRHREDIQNEFKEFYKKSANIGKHMGLRVFRRIIEDNSATFTFYSHRGHKIEEGENYKYMEYKTDNKSIQCMPGTGYTVLFPLKIKFSDLTLSGISVDNGFNLEENISSYIKEYACEMLRIDAAGFKYDGQAEKENMIYELSQKFITGRFDSDNKRRIIYISAHKLIEETAEYIVKAMIMAGNAEHIPDFVFYDCDKAFVRNFQNTMQVYFRMRELDYLFKKKEFVIALYTDRPIEGCFIVPGNISKTIWANRKNSYVGEGWNTGSWLPSDKVFDINDEEDSSDIPPYDILFEIDRDGMGETIFERYTLQVLDTDIQERAFGCKISETHMRLGSTIHINNFYEAELMFGNRLFVSRFAYLLAKQIYTEKKLDDADGITLYSYALYSETLIVELLNLMETLYPGKDIDYAILEREAEHRDFKHVDRIRYSTVFESEEKRKEHFQHRSIVIIVPINSTLKTHEKLISLFCESNPGISKDRFVSNFALVLVGSEDKNEYWEIEENKKILKNIKLDIAPAPHYSILIKVKYFEALGCKLCFPDNPLDEVPLVEVNAASTIPNQSFGLYGEADNNNIKYDYIGDEEQKLSVLKKSLIYSHVKRGENHYLYYFKTDEFFLENKLDIIKWLNIIGKKMDINRGEYHVLFCPAHFSNAGFLECVNRVIFHGTALVIRVDVDKEFRSNILAKYSNLAAFVNLLIENENREIIKVYYIDDSIITGRTFNRARSLMSSIVERYKQKESNIDVHIFEKIILLVDRNSMQSRLQYIGCWDSKNKTESQLDDNYFVYRTLHISSMRNHGDSCTLCQLEREAGILYKASATRQMSKYWKDQMNKFAIQSLVDKQDEQMAGKTGNAESDKKQGETAFRRMFCSHILAVALQPSRHGNRKENVISCFLKLLLEDYDGRVSDCGQDLAFEYMLSYLKIISRPFLMFDKAIKEAAFDILLILVEGLLDKRTVKTLIRHVNKQYLIKSQGLLKKLIEDVIRRDFSNNQKLDLFILLMKQLTEMKSNYFIRINNILNIVKFAAEYDISARNKLYTRYLHQTKKLLGVSSDTSKSAWFNHELCNKEGFQKLPDNVLGNLVLENTRAYFDGIEKMCRNLPLDEESVRFLCEERWYGAEFHHYTMFDKQINGENPPKDESILSFLEGSFRSGKESVPERDRANLAQSDPMEYFNGCLDKVRETYMGQREITHIKNLQKIITEELKKAQYRDFRSVLTDLEFMNKEEINIDGAVSVLAGMQLMNLCNEYKEESASKGEIEVICFHIVCLMEKILGARNVKIILECPLESEGWRDDIINEYNSLVEKSLLSNEDNKQDNEQLKLRPQGKKEYLEIADSGVKPDIIEEVETEVANRLISNREKQILQKEGYVIDRNDNYLIWEMGETKNKRKDERRLLIYAQFYKLDFPKDWQVLRNLFCMNYLLNNSVFGLEDIDYLFELVLADKERLIYNMEKAHSHTASSVKTAQCGLVKMEEEEDGSFRSFVLTLLSDLQVSQIYRQSLKGAYYHKNLDICALTCEEVFDVLYRNMQLVIINQKRISEKDIYVKICTEFPENGLVHENECRLNEDEKILSYSYANSGNEVFLLLLALIMNAAGPQRADIETQEGAECGIINVYLTKSEDGCLRIANKCGQEKIDVDQINEELEFQPRRNKGISLWSISRYIYGLVSILLRKEIELSQNKISTGNNAVKVLKELKGAISEALGERFKVRVGVEEGRGGIKYFYMDIPILREKYSKIFKSLLE